MRHVTVRGLLVFAVVLFGLASAAEGKDLTPAQRRANISRWEKEARSLGGRARLLRHPIQYFQLKSRARQFRLVAAEEWTAMPGQDRGPHGHVGTGPDRDETPDQPLTRAQQQELVGALRGRAQTYQGHIDSGEYRSLIGGKRRLKKLVRAFHRVADYEQRRLDVELTR